ncbi:MAG: hypothetical protein WA185_01155, partial [Candidatus Acidiferrales bacterium]
MAKKIKVAVYDDLRRSLSDAIAYERGQHFEDTRMIKIDRYNICRIAERIVANELEARGFPVSDLNKEGTAANADLLAVSPRQKPLQVRVRGSSNGPKDRLWWVGYGY